MVFHLYIFNKKKKKGYLQFNQQATEHTCNILTLYITQWQVLWYMCLDQPFPFVTNRLPGFTSYFHPEKYFCCPVFFLHDLLNMDITLKKEKTHFWSVYVEFKILVKMGSHSQDTINLPTACN